jgi:NAD(P)-dependent dehydrogenase (short-subunit alcohol dehydrogenase family)
MCAVRTYDYARLGPPPGAKVVVAGGCGGIGSAIVEGCVATGLETYVLDMQATYDAKPCPDGVTFVPMDAHEDESVQQAVGDLVAKTGGVLDAVINLVGAGNGPAPITELETWSWDEVISRNLRSAFLICKYTMPLLHKSGDGAVVNTASGVAYRGVKGVGSYAAAKGGLISMTKTLAVENAPTVRCNVIAPGGVTNKVKIIDGEVIGPMGLKTGVTTATIPLGRFADPEDIVPAALFLAGPSSAYMTAQVLQLSGGLVQP